MLVRGPLVKFLERDCREPGTSLAAVAGFMVLRHLPEGAVFRADDLYGRGAADIHRTAVIELFAMPLAGFGDEVC
ncbi:hypothetical protein D3C81_1877330 [compost metagenome]